jgi:type I restriction enzyme R subunit
MKVTYDTINEFGRFDELKHSVDITKARKYFEWKENVKLSIPKTHMKVDDFLRRFIFEGGFEIELPESDE